MTTRNKHKFPNAIDIAKLLLPLVDGLSFEFIKATLLKENCCDIFLSLSTAKAVADTRVFKISVEVM